MELLALDHFTGAVGAAFSVAAGDGQFELTLDSASELPEPGPATGSFRLEFRGPVQPVLPQATYAFRRAADSFDIFIVPIGQDAAGTRYEAIFTRLPPA